MKKQLLIFALAGITTMSVVTAQNTRHSITERSGIKGRSLVFGQAKAEQEKMDRQKEMRAKELQMKAEMQLRAAKAKELQAKEEMRPYPSILPQPNPFAPSPFALRHGAQRIPAFNCRCWNGLMRKVRRHTKLSRIKHSRMLPITDGLFWNWIRLQYLSRWVISWVIPSCCTTRKDVWAGGAERSILILILTVLLFRVQNHQGRLPCVFTSKTGKSPKSATFSHSENHNRIISSGRRGRTSGLGSKFIRSTGFTFSTQTVIALPSKLPSARPKTRWTANSAC